MQRAATVSSNSTERNIKTDYRGMDPGGLPGSGADVSPTMPDTPGDAATLTWFTYKKGDVWRTALWLECVRCQHGIRRGRWSAPCLRLSAMGRRLSTTTRTTREGAPRCLTRPKPTARTRFTLPSG